VVGWWYCWWKKYVNWEAKEEKLEDEVGAGWYNKAVEDVKCVWPYELRGEHCVGYNVYV